ncbi:hypothetical protein EAH57_15640 [Acinetobacter sp. 2JN-4]|uniref:hypothetical protein n=1 Tax=Acinetobacter sp. 2JN-4 TaxID=2479844 RepID=UPI000EF9C0CF|nr:hypothetical protein [Acinetobacter sp. 2JN-4]RLZ06572.1 hypothetical protein EAH57_15640 [Acinetobacter sp. 2JN-4]
MATNLGTLTLNLIAQTGSYTKGLNRAANSTDSAFKKMRGAVNTYGNVVGAVAASAVVGLAGLAYQTAQSAVELEKFALRANSTTQDFQKMAVGAQAYGIEQEKLSDMMKDFNEKLGEFTTIGSGGAVDFFEQIATKTEGSAAGAKKLALEMQKLSGPDALQLYVDKMQEAGVTQQQMSFYLESMASDMTDLIPLLLNGGDGMKLYSDAAERAGLVMDEKTIASAKVLKEQVYLLDLQMQGAKNQLMQAVIPAFVDIAGAFFDGSEQGLQFTQIADGIAISLKGVASVAIGAVTAIQLVGKTLGGMAAVGGAIFSEASWYEMNPIGLVKAAYDARKEIGVLTTEIKSDLHNTVIGAAERMDKMWKGDDSSAAKQMANLRELSGAQSGVTKGLDEWTDKQNKSTESTKQKTRAQSDLNQTYEAALRLLYEYGTEYQRIEHDLTQERSAISGAALKGSDKSRMLAEAAAISAARKQVYLLEYEQDVDAWSWSEDQKLVKHIAIEKARVNATKGMSKEERKVRLDSFDSVLKQEQAWLELEKQQRLLESRQFYMSDADYMQARYQLERDEMAKNLQLTQQERNARIAMLHAEEEFEKRKNLKDASMSWGQSYADMAGTGAQFQLEQERFNRYDDSQALFDAQMALSETAEEREAIWKAHNDRMFEIDKQYDLDTRNLSMSQYADALGAATGFFGEMLGRSSGTYKALYFAQKSFSLAQAGMNVYKAASDAYANEPGTVWQKIGAAALATVKSSSFVSLIQAATPQGFATGGQILGPGTGTSDSIPIMASNKEYMIRAAAAEKLGLENLNYINRTGELPKGFATGGLIGGDISERRPMKFSTGFNQSNGGDVNINVNVADSGVSTQGATSQDQRQLGQLIANAVRAVIRQEQRQGGLLSK